ncbi:MAG TPA: hypothetical protein PKM19_06310, partial [Pseudomonadales bacterium]|nr:hypothetical protein [Pseudomonadales bacterium]
MARQLLSRRGGAIAATALLLAVATLLWWLRYPAASVAASVQPISAPAGWAASRGALQGRA